MEAAVHGQAHGNARRGPQGSPGMVRKECQAWSAQGSPGLVRKGCQAHAWLRRATPARGAAQKHVEAASGYDQGILLDSDSDEHMCPRNWHEEVRTLKSPETPRGRLGGPNNLEMFFNDFGSGGGCRK